jgi:CubicO group peptidase (beta-lactamase class C family)
VHGFPGYATDAPLPTVPQVLDGAKPANTAAVRVDTTPGAVFRYSGGGTTIMQLVLSDVTGKSFPQLTKELVLMPAGMSNSTYEQPLPEARWPQASRAHDIRGAMVKGRWHVYPEMAAAGLWTTPTDLAKWALAIADARSGKPGAVLAKRTTDEMLTVQKAPMGIGPFLGGAGRKFHYGHGGSDEGFHSELIYYPETGQGVAITTNGDGGRDLMADIIAAVREEYGWPEPPYYRKVTPATLDEAQLQGVVGEYRADLSPTFSITLKVRREGQRLMMDGGDALTSQELIPDSATSVVGAESGFWVQLVRDATGQATALRLLGAEAKRVR